MWLIKFLAVMVSIVLSHAHQQEGTHIRPIEDEQTNSISRRLIRQVDYDRHNNLVGFDSGQDNYNIPFVYSSNNLNPSFHIDNHGTINDESDYLPLQNQHANYDTDIIKLLASNYRNKAAAPVKKIPFISRIQDNILNEPIPISQHIEISRPVPIPSYTHVPVGISKPYEITIPYPVLVPVPQPYPVEIPVNKPVAVPYVQEIKVPIEKIVLYPVVKNVPYPVTKNVPYPIEKQVTVQIPHPYPIEVPVLKTVLHKSKGNNGQGEGSNNHKVRKSDVDYTDYNGEEEQGDEKFDEFDYQTIDSKQNDVKSGNRDHYQYHGYADNKENTKKRNHPNHEKQSSQYNKGHGKNSKNNNNRRYT